MKTTLCMMTLAAAGVIGLASFALAERDAVQPPAGDAPDIGIQLVEGLRRTPGCLGVDVGDFHSGKSAIIAWFEDKAAATRWYDSGVHQRIMRMAFGKEAVATSHEPLEHVEDGVPIMVIASLTRAEKPEIQGVTMPISQIAIELYAPLPGGAYVNGRLAPRSFEVEHMKAYSER